MPKQTRHSTAYSGVYFVELANEDQSFFIRYKQNSKSFEERAGRSSQGWNAEKASFLRKERLSGVNPLGRYTLNSAGQMDVEKNWTFSGIFEAYLRLRPDLKGRENDIYRFRNYIKEDFGDIAPSEVVHDDIERLRHKLQNQQLKPATVRHVLELLRRLANYAFKKKFCQGLSFKIQMPTVKNQKTENLTQEQLEKLLRVLDDDPDKQVSNIVRLALYTGLRRGEIFSLKWKNIDFYGKNISIRSKKKEKCTVIPMNEMAEKVLAEHAHAEAKSEFVFPGRGGKKRTECKRPLLRIKNNAGLPDDFRLLQGLRHVYASMLASSGKVDMDTLQTLLTHKSPLMTQRYAHLREDALKDSNEKMDQENISITQNVFEEKTPVYNEERTDQNCEDSQENLAEENFSSDEVEEPVINNFYAEEDLKENQHEIISENILESSESKKFEETVQAAGQSFEEGFSKVAEVEQHTEIADQSQGEDDAYERLEENNYLEDNLTSTEAELQEQETVYTGVDVDPITMEVDLEEIVSAEELTELTEDLQVCETKAENKDSVFYEELTAVPSEVEENIEGDTEKVDYQEYSEENVGPEYSVETVGDSVFKENLFTQTEEEEEISGIPEEHGESFHAGETPEDEIPADEIEVQTNDEQVIQNTYWENEETDSAEESGETIQAFKGSFSEQDDVTQINDFRAENADSDYLDSNQQEFLPVEIESDDFSQETETADCIVKAEEETITSNAYESHDDEVRLEDYPGAHDFATEHDNGEVEIDKSEAASTKGVNNVKISENTEVIIQSDKKSGKNNIFLSKTYQNSEKQKSLKDVKIDLELKTENEAFVINTDSSSRSSILELKKELMSLSKLIKSNPVKVKNSTEAQNQ